MYKDNAYPASQRLICHCVKTETSNPTTTKQREMNSSSVLGPVRILYFEKNIVEPELQERCRFCKMGSKTNVLEAFWRGL